MADPTFVFQGTVLALGESTLPNVEANDLTARVRVDRVIRAPAAMERISGREITIQLREPARAKSQAIFSADGWVYGDSMAVIESASRTATSDRIRGIAADVTDETMDDLESPAARDRAATFRTALSARADEASRVVIGRVVAVRQLAASAERRRRLTEHDPNWTEATVEVDETLKGETGRKINVLFANSDDVMWRDAPKLDVGQKAVMLLHPAPPNTGRRRADAVLDALDVQPVDTGELLTRLHERERRSPAEVANV
jgi:hypothetical protein